MDMRGKFPHLSSSFPFQNFTHYTHSPPISAQYSKKVGPLFSENVTMIMTKVYLVIEFPFVRRDDVPREKLHPTESTVLSPELCQPDKRVIAVELIDVRAVVHTEQSSDSSRQNLFERLVVIDRNLKMRFKKKGVIF